MAAVRHTLDNLCQKEKDKVLELLRQLNEFKKRCAALEQEIESKTRDNTRLLGRDEVTAHELEATQTRLIEAIEVWKQAQLQIENLSLRLQTAESHRKAISARLRDSEADVEVMREKMRRSQQKYDRRMVSTSTQTRPLLDHKESNTVSSALDLRETAVQMGDDPMPRQSEVMPTEPEPPQQHCTEEVQQQPTQSTDASLPSGPTSHVSAPDDELFRLISILNPF
jgi:chromosome segregation ATPase